MHRIWIDRRDGNALRSVEFATPPRVGEHIDFEIKDVNDAIWDITGPLKISGKVTKVIHRCRDSRRGREPYITTDITLEIDERWSPQHDE